ncbi:hypothetical protein J3D45_001576 [Microbacterium foliorum]|uniref:hypothetical protein n=1 Tax=Microbacterium foliorum TaxID=104336 RepID=UPI00209EF444|nr:hypothetical protein [Microbacterium foliorum]MCP1429078.1 hypothetical protein [Microbacterium foliorum]
MSDTNNQSPADLTGSVDDRTAQLAEIPLQDQSAEWLRRQLASALSAWAEDRTALDIDREARADF